MVVYLNILATLQVQPERQKSIYLMVLSSSFHAQCGLCLEIISVASSTSDGMIIPIPRCSNGLYWYTTSNGFELQIIAIAIEMAKGGNLKRKWSLTLLFPLQIIL
jgi:hypothetical protein